MSLSFTLSAILWHFAGALIGRRDGWLKWLKPTCFFPPHWLMLSVPICNSVEAQIQTTNSTWPQRSLFCLYLGVGWWWRMENTAKPCAFWMNVGAGERGLSVSAFLHLLILPLVPWMAARRHNVIEAFEHHVACCRRWFKMCHCLDKEG